MENLRQELAKISQLPFDSDLEEAVKSAEKHTVETLGIDKHPTKNKIIVRFVLNRGGGFTQKVGWELCEMNNELALYDFA